MSESTKRIRVLLAKVGVDIHERGALVLMKAFRDAGMEVIYTGRYQTPESVIKAALQEDVDVIAITDHTGGMRYIGADIMKLLKKYECGDIHVVAGGLIPPKDVAVLEAIGITGNYGPGTPLSIIVEHIVAKVQTQACTR